MNRPQSNIRDIDDDELLAGYQFTRTQNLPQVKDRSGVNSLMRAALSTASTDAGKMNILRNFGLEPTRNAKGQLSVVKNGEVFPVDPEGFDIGDILDFAGDVLPTAGGILGTMAGVAAGAPAAAVGAPMAAYSGAMGGTAGGLAGEMAREGIGMALGSGEDFNQGNMKFEAAAGVPLSLMGRMGAGTAKRIAAPFRANTAISKAAGAVDQRLGTQIEKRLPLSARADSPLLANVETRVSEALPTQDRFTRQVREPLQREFGAGFDAMRGTRPERSAGEVGASLMGAATTTLDARKAEVDGLYDTMRRAIPEGDASTAMPWFGSPPVKPTNTAAAVERIREFTGSGVLDGFDISQGLRDQLRRLDSDVGKIHNFEQLDAYRKFVGNMLSSHGAQEQFAQVGLDKHLRGLYSALLDDAMVVGQRHGFGDLANVARTAAAEIIDLDKASVMRLLKDPDKAANILDALASKTSTADWVKQFRRKIGDMGTEGSLRGTPEGVAAWENVQDLLMKRLRDEATDEATGNLSGMRLISALRKAGGPEVLEEFFGKDMTDTLFQFADVMKKSNAAERMWGNFSHTGSSMEMQQSISELGRGVPGITSLLGRLGATTLLGEGIMNPAAQSRLIKGVAQGPLGQAGLTLGGAAVPTLGARTAAKRAGMRD
jgi:hypothetical protein